MIVRRCGNAHNAVAHTPLAALSAERFKLSFIMRVFDLPIGRAEVWTSYHYHWAISYYSTPLLRFTQLPRLERAHIAASAPVAHPVARPAALEGLAAAQARAQRCPLTVDIFDGLALLR
jgi:hypothetical protein